MEYALLLVVLQYFVAIVFDAANNFSDEISRLAGEEPAKSNNALRYCAQVVEQMRGPVRLADVIDAVRSIVKLRHELRGLLVGLLGFSRDVEVGALGFEGLLNGSRLTKSFS